MQYELKIPDIGSDEEVSVVSVAIKVGDKIQKEQTVAELENDKASMEVPSDCEGVVEKLLLKAGDKVKTGDRVAIVNIADAVNTDNNTAITENKATTLEQNTADSAGFVDGAGEIIPFHLPDLGTNDEVNVVEIAVSKGQNVNVGDTLLTLETDKASMEVPSEIAGIIISIVLKAGDKVKSGDLVGQIMSSVQETQANVSTDTKIEAKETEFDLQQPEFARSTQPLEIEAAAEKSPQTDTVDISSNIDEEAFAKAYASPSVRKFARELGADLGKIKGTGRKGRIVESDVKLWVKAKLQTHNSGSAVMFTTSAASAIPKVPKVDFAKYGAIENQALSRINQLTGEAMTRAWLNVPMVTQFDKVDITDLESFRQALKIDAEKLGVRVSLLPFIVKALCRALQEFPRFNSSLSEDAKSLVIKKYFHIGIAVDTPDGLVVPVLRDADKKGIFETAAELAELGKKARAGKLKPSDFGGASITISSLGGLGGEYFTPIVNTPEAAILGVSKSKIEAVWDGEKFNPRLLLPLSLSYDHRIIDGALGAKMISYLGKLLNDYRRLVL
ncbi:MAG: 2-oxo acid dehydrogenase subunit E2 [Cardiobacteriaceae bacterium]|nr:2-oxo acid dehydrogenase subunit E2 [Cardiobacteriaceae bacterium]